MPYYTWYCRCYHNIGIMLYIKILFTSIAISIQGEYSAYYILTFFDNTALSDHIFTPMIINHIITVDHQMCLTSRVTNFWNKWTKAYIISVHFTSYVIKNIPNGKHAHQQSHIKLPFAAFLSSTTMYHCSMHASYHRESNYSSIHCWNLYALTASDILYLSWLVS